MKIDTARSTQTTFAQTPVGFDEESVGLMADILSGLYTNPHEAVVREYAANGLDAHAEAGIDSTRTPVEVTLPQPFDPHLIIQDRGTGMTQGQAERLFARYVSSDKRDSNEGIGGFGIGSLSAFAVADLMMVTTIIDGTKTELTVIRTEKGPQITESTASTITHPNGTTVTIPVDPHQDWESHARNALAYTGGGVTIDGEKTEDPRGEKAGKMLSGLPYGYESRGRGDRIVMGGMNYRIPDSVMETVKLVVAPMYGRSFFTWVIEVPIGTVRLAYDRESIMDTTANGQSLAAYIETHYADALREQFVGSTDWAAVFKMLDAQADFIPAEALKQVRSVADSMNTGVGDRHAYAGFEMDNGARTKIDSGFVLHRVLLSKSVMFFPMAGTRSPKVRRWLIDHDQAAGPAVAVAVEDPQALEDIAQASFTVMDEDALRCYQPVIKTATASRPKNTGYLVLDPTSGEQTMMEPEDIAGQYEAMVFGREYDREHWNYPGSQADIETVRAAWGGERIALVRTTANQQQETAKKRIGLPARSLTDAETAIKDNIWSLITDQEKHLLAALTAGAWSVADIASLDPQASSYTDALQGPRRVIEVADRLGQASPFDLGAARRTLAALEDPQAFEPMRARIAQAGLDTQRWIVKTLRDRREELTQTDPWGEVVTTITAAVRRGIFGDQNVEAAVAGYLVLGLPKRDRG